MGQGKKSMSGKHNIPGLGKYYDSMPAHGAVVGKGIKVDKNNISNSERQVFAGAFNSFGQAKVISGGHPKGGFMHKSKSMGNPKGQGYDDREDESLGMKDGKESDKKQSLKDRRDEREGEDKSLGKKPDGLTKYPKESMPKSEKLPMVEKDGKMVPFYAADKKGKM